MSTPATAYYHEIEAALTASQSAQAALHALQSLLERLCNDFSDGLLGDYSSLFSRLFAVCRTHHIDFRQPDHLRRHLRLALDLPSEQAQTELHSCAAALAQFVAELTGIAAPEGLIRPLSTHVSHSHKPTEDGEMSGKPPSLLHGIVSGITSSTEATIWLADGQVDCEPTGEITLHYPTHLLYTGAHILLIDPRSSTRANGWKARLVVVEPDYLIDVTSLTNCFNPASHSPIHYLLRCLSPKAHTAPILLGQAAGKFLEVCIAHSSQATPKLNLYHQSLQAHFEEYSTEYAYLPDNEIDASYFQEARRQFDHIYQTVAERLPAADVDIDPCQSLLEAAFICPTLGLRGRLDLMTNNHRRLLELKSGSAQRTMRERDEVKPRKEHLMQMSLYVEMLRYNFNLPWYEVGSSILYSRYPRLFVERVSAEAISEAMDMRNAVICLLHRLHQPKEVIASLCNLNPETLNAAGLRGKFWEAYIKPQLSNITRPLSLLRHDPRLAAYFAHFLAFTLRELFLQKTTDVRPDSLRGFAATWTTPRSVKLAAGLLLPNLHLEEITTNADGAALLLHFRTTPIGLDTPTQSAPNFNQGEMILLYACPSEETNVTNSQLLQGYIEHIAEATLTIRLLVPQPLRPAEGDGCNDSLLTIGKLYAIEHDSTDSPSLSQVRNLHCLLSTSPSRRQLLLGQRQPAQRQPQPLITSMPHHITPIVKGIIEADDFYLLLGPPGTGKTSIAIYHIVNELYASGETILLAAYTNRAVDELCAMLTRLAAHTGLDYMRIGQEATCAPEYRSHLWLKRAAALPHRHAVRHLTRSCRIYVGTVTSLTSHDELFHLVSFDTLLVDEAAQLLEPQLMGLLCTCHDNRPAVRRFVLIGDHRQLPAVVLQPLAQTVVSDPEMIAMGIERLSNSLFERLWRALPANSPFKSQLLASGRMHQVITVFASRHFYDGGLNVVPLPHQLEVLSPTLPSMPPYARFVATSRMGFIPVVPQRLPDNARANPEEAQAVARLVATLQQLHPELAQSAEKAAKGIGIIVPFRCQIAAIRAALQMADIPQADHFTIDTVECFQGSQRDYIIFSTTISRRYQLELLSPSSSQVDTEVDRKLNVALTRTRLQFFLVGHPHLLAYSPIYRHLMEASTRWNEALTATH